MGGGHGMTADLGMGVQQGSAFLDCGHSHHDF